MMLDSFLRCLVVARLLSFITVVVEMRYVQPVSPYNPKKLELLLCEIPVRSVLQ